MLTNTPRAPFKLTPSSNGHATACSAATLARSGPEAIAVPSIAWPCSPIMVFTSSKSTLTLPSTLIISAIPAQALCSTSSAALKQSDCVASSSINSYKFSFKTTMSECTYFDNSPMPSSDIFMRLAPSKEKGLVTTPTVKIPSSFATSATTGPAPVPVPPPIPAVINTILAPLSAARISSRANSAAARP